MGARRFELIDPSVNAQKFWEVEVDGSEMTTRWGRIGAAPSQKTKRFGSAAKAEAEAEKLVKEKAKKGYVLVDAGSKTKGKKKSSGKGKKSSGKGKKPSGKKCAHCGMASKGPTDCPEPWEHGNLKCSCAWCKANALLTTPETNWLAKHGWSSAQITEMNKTPAGRKEARALIKAGKPKKPGVNTEAAVGGPTNAEIKAYRDDLLVAGVGFKIPRELDTADIAKMISHSTDGPKDVTAAVKFALTYGGFSDGKRCLLVVPSDIAENVKSALDAFGWVKPKRGTKR